MQNSSKLVKTTANPLLQHYSHPTVVAPRNDLSPCNRTKPAPKNRCTPATTLVKTRQNRHSVQIRHRGRQRRYIFEPETRPLEPESLPPDQKLLYRIYILDWRSSRKWFGAEAIGCRRRRLPSSAIAHWWAHGLGLRRQSRNSRLHAIRQVTYGGSGGRHGRTTARGLGTREDSRSSARLARPHGRGGA